MPVGFVMMACFGKRGMEYFGSVGRPCLFPRPPMARVTFLAGKVTKTASRPPLGPAFHTPDYPAMFVVRAPRRTHTSLYSNNRRFPARTTALLGCAKGGELSGHPGQKIQEPNNTR